MLQPKKTARFVLDNEVYDLWQRNELQTPISRLGNESNAYGVFSSDCDSLDWMIVETDLRYWSLSSMLS